MKKKRENMKTQLKSKQEQKNRIGYLDIARGISIILMVIGHVVQGWKRKIIFSFHMPLFIIISGMFFRPNKKFKEELVGLLTKLILPYIFTIVILYFLKYIIFNQPIDIIKILQQIGLAYSNKKTFFTNVGGVGALWFIPFLVLCKITYFAIHKIGKENEILKTFLCITLSVTGIYLTKIKIFLPWSFDVVLAAIIFYHLGYVMKKYNLLEKMLSDYKTFLCIILLYIIGIQFGHIELAIRSYPYSFLCFITAFCGTLILFQISKVLEKFTKYMKKLLCWYGKNSMYILCAHYLENSIIKYPTFGIHTKIELIITKLCLITIITATIVGLNHIIQKWSKT